MPGSSKRLSSTSLKEQNALSLLHSSIIKGNKSTLQEALKLGCKLNDKSKFGDPPIVAAAGVDPYTVYDNTNGRDKMLDIIKLLLEQDDCDVNARGSGGETALHRAMTARSTARIQMLVDHGCDVDIRDSRGQTALFAATLYVEGLELLLKSHPQLDVYDLSGYTPLMYAVMSESPATVQTTNILVKAGCNTNSLKQPERFTPLMVTLNGSPIPRSEHRVEKTLLLLAHGAEIDAQDYQGNTVLHHAITCGCLDLIKILLKNKASVNLKNNNGHTAIDLSDECTQHKEEIVRLITRAVDKSSRLLPYEDAVLHLQTLYTSLNLDEELPVEKKQYLKSQIDKLETSLQEVINSGRGTETMSVEDKRMLIANKQALSDEMMPHLILSELEQKKILSAEDVLAIKAEKTRKLMSIKLLNLLPHRGPRAFNYLLHALKKSKQDHVCEIFSTENSTNM